MTLAAIAAVLLLAAAVGLMPLFSALSEFGRKDYGIKTILMPDGQKIYLKRPAGAFYDRLSLSLNGDRCVGPDDKTDYRFVSQGAGSYPIYYRPEKNVLTVYASELDPPSTKQWKIQINQVPLDVGALQRLERDYEQIGVLRTEVPTDALGPCGWL